MQRRQLIHIKWHTSCASRYYTCVAKRKQKLVVCWKIYCISLNSFFGAHRSLETQFVKQHFVTYNHIQISLIFFRVEFCNILHKCIPAEPGVAKLVSISIGMQCFTLLLPELTLCSPAEGLLLFFLILNFK